MPLSPGDGAAPSPRALHYASILGLALIMLSPLSASFSCFPMDY